MELKSKQYQYLLPFLSLCWIFSRTLISNLAASLYFSTFLITFTATYVLVFLSKQSRTFPNVPSPNKLFISSENNKIKSYKPSSHLHVAKKLIAKTANQLRYELFYLNTNNAIQHNKIIIISSQIMKTVSSDSS